MALWFVLGLMTVAAAFAVLWPLGRAVPASVDQSSAAIYRDQLAEVARDADIGLVGSREAEAARIEISRRLLAAAADAEQGVSSRKPALRRALALVALLGLPAVSAALYLHYGSPEQPDMPLASRAQSTAATASLDDLVMKVEQHLEQNPGDGRGWEVLAPVLMKLGRYDDAVRAYRNALAYNGENASRHADLGEALGAAANGVITTEAKAEFERAHALEPNGAKARYFLGLAAQQDGRAEQASAIWRELLQGAPDDAPWRPTVEAALASLDMSAAPILSNETMAAANGMSAEQRDAMIRGMINRLAERLKQNGNDAQGWLRLVRALIVLGDRDRARAAVNDARLAISDQAARQKFNEQIKDFGLDG